MKSHQILATFERVFRAGCLLVMEVIKKSCIFLSGHVSYESHEKVMNFWQNY